MGEVAASGLAPLALTLGDPAGIGPEITLKAWQRRHASSLAPFCVFGDAAALENRSRALALDVPIENVSAPDAAPALFSHALPVLDIPAAALATAGQPDVKNSPAVIDWIARSVAATASGHVRAVVTNPIAKSVLYGAGFRHPGHTEYLAALAETHWPGRTYHPVMMLVCEALKVVPLTIHVPLGAVPGLISRDLIQLTARITASALQRDFGIARPRIVVAGLNPHAGEDGSIGTEDRDIIAPALLALQNEGLNISGPFPADTLFHATARAAYDAAIAMYHDQALIPVKTLAFDEGVNVTLGLPFVRTSPDHGTAFDIATKGTASPASLIEALKQADIMSRHRAVVSP